MLADPGQLVLDAVRVGQICMKKTSSFFVDETYIFLRPFRGHCFYYSFLRAILQEKNEKLCNPL